MGTRHSGACGLIKKLAEVLFRPEWGGQALPHIIVPRQRVPCSMVSAQGALILMATQ